MSSIPPLSLPPPPPPPLETYVPSNYHPHPNIYNRHFQPTYNQFENSYTCNVPSTQGIHENLPKEPFSTFSQQNEMNKNVQVQEQTFKSPTTIESNNTGSLLTNNTLGSLLSNLGNQQNPRKRVLSKTEGNEDNENTYFRNSKFPKELIQKFSPLKCDLCCVTVNSTVQAKMHYTGKQHEKKVTAYLVNWSKETGEPMPKQYGPVRKMLSIEALHCKVCDIPLTSSQHAEQHYMGKNHRKNLNREQSLFSPIPAAVVDPSGRFGIGESFRTDTPAQNCEPESPISKKGKFYCDLCQIVTTSPEQLEMHYNGAKHKKVINSMKKPGSWIKPPLPPPSLSISAPADSILASVIKNEDGKKVGAKDYSIYRTPSGQFYCQPCNLTLNSEPQFSQHCESKKHKFKLATMKKPSTNKHKLVK